MTDDSDVMPSFKMFVFFFLLRSYDFLEKLANIFILRLGI